MEENTEEDINSNKEIFKQVPFDGCESYYVSSFGRLWNTVNRKFSDPDPDKYGMIHWKLFIKDKNGKSIGNKGQTAHILIATLFIPNPDNHPHVIHIDLNRSNNRITNLEWVSKEEFQSNRNLYNTKELKQEREVEEKEKFQIRSEELKQEREEHELNLQKSKEKPEIIIEPYQIDLCVEELWKPLPIPGFEHYYISTHGRCYNSNNKTKKYLSQKPHIGGYIQWKLSHKDKTRHHFCPHILVARTFIKDPEDKDKDTVDHIDNIKTNNRVDNLRYANQKEQHDNRVLSDKPTNSRKVVEYGLDWVPIKEWKSIVEAATFYKNHTTVIINCCKDRNLTFKDHHWLYIEDADILSGKYEGEEWRLSPYPEYKPIYVSDFGRVKNADGRVLKGKEYCGYLFIKLYYVDTGKDVKRPAHRLIHAAFAVEGRQDHLIVNHLNCIKNDNRPENLEYTTVKGNSIHATEMGLNKSCKAVIKLDKDGKEIERFPSLKKAGLSVGHKNGNNIGVAVKNGKFSAGFKWKLVEDE